jgi:uncharacterized membrane protein
VCDHGRHKGIYRISMIAINSRVAKSAMIDLNPQTLFHIAAGTVSLLGGAVAMVARKGGATHRLAGNAFAAGMLAMCASGVLLAILIDERFTILIGLFSAYLVATGWLAAHRPIGARDWRDFALATAAVCIALGYVAAGLAPSNDNFPAAAYYVVAGLVGFAAAMDARLFLTSRVSAGARLARHLWRMCMALTIASASTFLGQQDEFPEVLQVGFAWALPSLAVLAAMVFWLVRSQSRRPPKLGVQRPVN